MSLHQEPHLPLQPPDMGSNGAMEESAPSGRDRASVNVTATGGVPTSIAQPKEIDVDEDVNGADPKPAQLAEGWGAATGEKSRLSNVSEASSDHNLYEC